MTMTDEIETAPAELIEDYGTLYPRQVSYNRYRVLSLGGDQGNTHYQVNIEDGTCTCPDMQYNEDEQSACKHLAVALYQATDSMSADQVAVRDIAHYIRELRGVVSGLDGEAGTTTTDSQETAETSSDGADDDTDDDHDGDVRMDADPGGDGVMSDVSEWFAQAAGFAGFDPSIIELSWAEAEGARGIAVERQPFDGGYYDEEWVDKEGYEEERDAAGDLLSSRDEFRWYGEPDYVYFIPEADVEALTE